MRVTLGIAIIAIASSTLIAKAQIPTPLSGVKTLSLLVERLPKDAGECGITEDLERQAFMYPASSAKFNIVGANENPDAWFYLAITTIHSPAMNVCASSIDIMVKTVRQLKLYSATTQFADVQLWHLGWVGLSRPSVHGEYIEHQIEDFTKQFVIEWNSANK